VNLSPLAPKVHTRRAGSVPRTLVDQGEKFPTYYALQPWGLFFTCRIGASPLK